MKYTIQYTVRNLLLGCAAYAALASPSHCDTFAPPTLRQNAEVRTEYKTDYVDESIDEIELFNGNEWSVDVFGMYNFEAKRGTYGDGFGGGVGVNYFFNRYVGMGLEGNWWPGDGIISTVAGNLILRYPIESLRLAPYMIGGIGGNFGADNTSDQFNAGGGLGLEYRFTEHWGIFGDSRYIWTEQSNDYVTTRFGLRFAF